MSCKLDNLQGYTHRKHPYYAKAIQLTPHNFDLVIGTILATTKEAVASKYGDDAIMVRFANPLPRQCTPDTMYIGDWVVTGENGVTKIYKDAAFKIKYEELEGAYALNEYQKGIKGVARGAFIYSCCTREGFAGACSGYAMLVQRDRVGRLLSCSQQFGWQRSIGTREETTMKFQKNIAAVALRTAKIGTTFVLEGHSASKTASVFRAGFSFTTNMGFLVFKPSMPVVKVTVITITGMPSKEGTIAINATVELRSGIEGLETDDTNCGIIVTRT